MANHHSSSITSQPILQTERTILHDKSYDKLINNKTRRSKDDPRRDGICLPEVRGAEGISDITHKITHN